MVFHSPLAFNWIRGFGHKSAKYLTDKFLPFPPRHAARITQSVNLSDYGMDERGFGFLFAVGGRVFISSEVSRPIVSTNHPEIK